MPLSHSHRKNIARIIEDAARKKGEDNILTSIVLEAIDPCGDLTHRNDMIQYLGALCMSRLHDGAMPSIGQMTHMLNERLIIASASLFGKFSWSMAIPVFRTGHVYNFVCRFNKDMTKDVNYPFPAPGISKCVEMRERKKNGEAMPIHISLLRRDDADGIVAWAKGHYGHSFVYDIGNAAMTLICNMFPGVSFHNIAIFMSLMASSIFVMASTETRSMAIENVFTDKPDGRPDKGSLIIAVSQPQSGDPQISNSSLRLSMSERELVSFRSKATHGETMDGMEGIWVSSLKMPGYRRNSLGHIS